ncbi:MAG: DUF1553 domain-containing protein, partial [Candidatus Omnitrophica bacterium]|nr:DUF1553 domain-containing protein [Candidatus Omnitrophota bacterium]
AETYPDGRHKWFERPDLEDGKPNNLAGESAATYLHRVINSPSPRTMTLATGSNDAIKVWVNGHVVLDKNVKRGLKENEDTFTVPLERGENNLLMKVVNYGGMYSFFFRRVDEQVGDVPMRIERILASAPGSRSEPDALELRGYYRRLNSPEWKALDEERLKAVEAEKAFEATIPTTMVMREMEEPRETFVLNRGQYDQPGDKVLAALPSAFPPLPEGAPSNRLGLAKWLVDPANPLTARVTVNRFWQQQFGVGIVETAEDFGTQGTLPSHPELLDWLATEFVRTGWDVKALHRLMVTSAAFRQSSKLTPLMKEKDPGNRLLARGPRYRMDAEVLRDTALALGGILVRTLGGPSVRPYQPPGLWEEMAYGDGYSAQIFVQDHGEALYRRSMYTFWKRQVPPPNMQIFDAPSREVCQMRRPRTNTPLQALALLNDPQVVEAARHFAARMMTETGGDPMSRAAYGFTLATARTPSAKELAVLVKVYEAQLAEYKANAEAATKLLTVGESPRNDSLDPAEHAAWTVIASLLMNLDETVTLG